MRELFETRHHCGDATGARVSEGAAAKRREARAKQHRGVDEILAVHDALAQAGDTLVHQHEYQAVGEIGRCARAVRWRLDRLAVAPHVEAFAALAPELLGREQFVESGDLGHGTPELLRDDLANVRGDVVGLDVASHVGEIIAQELGRPVTQIARLNELLAAKKLGRKSGEGFYLWRDGKAVKPPAEGASAPPDLTDRLILVMVNECVACLRERIVENEDLVDAAVLFGTGFAPFRGGPLTYARARGIAPVVARLTELAQRYGERFHPDEGWVSLAGAQKRDGA